MEKISFEKEEVQESIKELMKKLRPERKLEHENRTQDQENSEVKLAKRVKQS